MVDARILIQCNSWIKERAGNLEKVPGLTEEKKNQYKVLFNCSQYLVNWLNQQLSTGVFPPTTGNAEQYFSPANYQSSCSWLASYYTSIANIAENDLKQSENKQKKSDEQTMIVAIAFLRIIEYFKKAQN